MERQKKTDDEITLEAQYKLLCARQDAGIAIDQETIERTLELSYRVREARADKAA